MIYKYLVICTRCKNKYISYSFFNFFQMKYFFGEKVYYCEKCTKELGKKPSKVEKKFTKIYLFYD